MKAEVTGCWSGSSFYFRVEATVNGRYTRFRVGEGENQWTRETATDALDTLVQHGAARRNVKFNHR